MCDKTEINPYYAKVRNCKPSSDAVLDALAEGLDTDALFKSIWSAHPNKFKRRMAAQWADWDDACISAVERVWQNAIDSFAKSCRWNRGCVFSYGVCHLLFDPGYEGRLWIPISWMFDAACGILCCDMRGGSNRNKEGYCDICGWKENFPSGYLENTKAIVDLRSMPEIPGLTQNIWESLKWDTRRQVLEARKQQQAFNPNVLPGNCRTFTRQGESPIEDRLLSALHAAGVLVVSQYAIGPYRLDFAVPSHKLAIECDGHDFHSSKEQRAHDAKRDRYLLAQGWRTVRFTGSEIYQNAASCAAEVARLLETC